MFFVADLTNYTIPFVHEKLEVVCRLANLSLPNSKIAICDSENLLQTKLAINITEAYCILAWCNNWAMVEGFSHTGAIRAICKQIVPLITPFKLDEPHGAAFLKMQSDAIPINSTKEYVYRSMVTSPQEGEITVIPPQNISWELIKSQKL